MVIVLVSVVMTTTTDSLLSPSIKSGKMENLLKVVSSKKAGCVRQQTILWAKLLDENSSWTNLNDKIPYVDPRPHV